MKKKSRILGNESGVAMLMALTSITILAVLAGELIYETEVYHKIVFNSLDQLRAQELAKSGLKLARLQTLAGKKANQALAELGKAAPISQVDVDRIWQTPLLLPPPVLPGSSIGVRDAVKKLTDKLDLSGSLVVNIYGESGKLNLNRLVWRPETRGNQPGAANPAAPPAPAPGADPNADPLLKLRQSFAVALNEMLKQKRDESEEFRLKYEALTGEILIGNVLSWIDPRTEVDGEGVPKQSYYRDQNPSYSIKNAPLYSLEELHLVKDFDDTLVDFMSKNFTALLTEGINVNSIEDTMIKALFPKIAEDTLVKFNEKRTETGFSKPDDFWTFMQTLGFGQEDKKVLDDAGISIVTTETAFRVEIEARSGDARKVWVAHLGAAPPKPTQAPNQPVQIDPNTGQPLNNSNTSPSGTASNDNSVPLVVYLKTD